MTDVLRQPTESTPENGHSAHQHRLSLPLILATIIFLAYSLLVMAVPGHSLHLNQGQYETLDGQWTVTLPDGQIIHTHLPAALAVNKNDPIQADYMFEHDYDSGSVLQIRASMQQIRVFLDQTLVFASEPPASSFLTLPQASVWHLVPLPPQLTGRKLTLEISSPVDVMSGVVNPVVIGSANTLIWQLFIDQWPTLLMILFLVVIGLTSLILQLVNHRLDDARLLYLGLFALSVATWFFSEARLMQLVTGRQLLIGSISYIMIAFIPAFFLLYLRDTVLRQFRRLLTVAAVLFLLWCPTALSLQLAGLAHLIELAVYVNIATGMTVVMILVLLVISTRREHSRAARNMLLAFIGLGLATVSEVIAFLKSNFDMTAQYSRFGIMFFFALIVVESIRSVQRLVQADKEARMLSRLAYFDVMSGISNRLAFDRDIEQRIQRSDDGSFRLITMDINDLKVINDQHGHQAGDEAIRRFCHCLNEIFTAPDHCYRTGGDEFSVICPQTGQAMFEDKIHRLQDCLSTRKDQPYPLITAIGSGIFHMNDTETLHDFLNRVDQSMYRHKQKLKQQGEQANDNTPFNKERSPT